LDQTKVENLLDPNFKLIFAKSTDSIIETLKLLQTKGILSVPVYDEHQQKWLGLVDVFDILTVLIFMSDLKSLVEALNKKEVDYYSFVETELKVLKDESVATILNSSQHNPWCPVSRLKPLHSLMDIFSRDVNLQRVPIVDDDGDVIGLISQSTVINFLYKNVEQFPDTAAIKVKDTAISSPVISVGFDQMAIAAYKLMVSHGVTGIAIVDKEGKLASSLSVSDFKGSLESNLFHDLCLPIGLYLEKETPEFERRLSSSPISCNLESNIYELLHKLSVNHIHRIFVTDSENKPIGVLGLGDIISMMNMDRVFELGKQKRVSIGSQPEVK